MPIAVEFSKHAHDAIMGSRPTKKEDEAKARAEAAAIIKKISEILFPNNHKELEYKRNEIEKIFGEFERDYMEMKEEILEEYSASNEEKIKKEYGIRDNEIEGYRRERARSLLDNLGYESMKRKIEGVISNYKVDLKTISKKIKEVFNEIKKLEKLGWEVNLTYKEGWEGHKAVPIPPARGIEFYQPKITKFEGKNKYGEMMNIVMEFANLSSEIITSDIEDDISKKTYGISFLIDTSSNRVTKGGLNIYNLPFLHIKIDLSNKRVDVELSNTVFFK